MRTIWQWVSLCAILIASAVLPSRASAQVTPTLQGTFVADPAVPALISPLLQGSQFFVLNQDLSLLTYSTADNSLNGTCGAPTGFSATSVTPRTFLNDTRNAYFTAASSSGANEAVSGFSFINTGLCQAINGPTVAGGVPTYIFSSNDTFHARYYVLSGFNGNGPDTLTVEVNLNNALSGGNYVTQLKTVPLDAGAQYTSMVTDTSAGATGSSLTAITELKTATSPGNLWIYNQSSGAAYKILGPGGVPLPAVGSFLIPAQTNDGGALLVLVNQDNLTSTNLSNPPLDTTPFTIIDLGQLMQTFSIQTTGGTVTLPFVTQISATTPYFAMLGAAYNPVNRLVYALVGGGSLSGVTGSVISYDPFHPGSPGETLVADVSNIPFNYGAYPQLALSAAAGTLQILTSNPSVLYSVGIVGTGNLAVAVSGSTFPDSNFQPTSIAANPLMGETYIASTSGQVDILKSAAAKPAATFSINGPDIATMTQSYSLQATALSAVVDTALRAAPVTITATPPYPGTPFTVSAGTFSNFGLNPSSISITFPALGVYTLVASIPATANYPAITSNPVNVTVASNFIAGVYPTTLAITAPANSSTTAVNVLVNLNGSTYAPTGHIDVKDGTGKIVGTTYFNGGALVQPTTVAVTLAQGANTLTAVYSGDAQNAPATSPALQVSVGTVVTPTLALTAPGSAFVGNTVSGNVTFRSTTTNVPTGSVTIFGLLNGSSTPIALTTVTAAQAFTGAGANFGFTAPVAGTYEIYASYAGDTNYASAVTVQQSLVTNLIPVNTTTALTGSTTQTPGVPFSITVKLTSGTTQATPTGNVVVTAVLNSTGASITLSTIPAAQAFVSGGYSAQVVIAAAGNYTVTANYSGDSNFNGSSNSVAVTVGATTISTSVSLTGASAQSAGVAFPLTVKLTPASSSQPAPTGNMVISAVQTGGATTTLATVTAAQALAAGGFVAQVTLSAAGSYNVTAAYAGDTNFAASSGSLSITVAGTATPTTLGVSAPSNVLTGASFVTTVTLKASGLPTSAITGNVTLMATGTGGTVNSYALGTMPATAALANGGVQFTGSIPAAGTYALAAVYPGDANYGTSSGSVVIAVAQPTASVGLSGVTNQVPGVAFPLTVRLTPQSGATGTPTGNVILSTLVGTTKTTLATVTATQALASGGYQARVTLSSAGSFTITAAYAGDANFSGSTSSLVVTATAVATITISPQQQTTEIGAPNTLCVLLSTKITTTPTGTILLSEVDPGGNQVTLHSVSATNALTTSCGVAYTALVAGTYVFTATYPGDSNYPALTATLSLDIERLVTTTTLAGASTAVASTPYQVTTTLTTPPATNVSGNITITATPNGSSTATVTIMTSAIAASNNNGVANNLLFPSAGTYTVVASYPGDAGTQPSTSAPLVVVVSPQPSSNFTLTLDGPLGISSNNPLFNQATPPTTGLTLTTAGAGPGPVTLSVSGNAPGVFVFRDAVTNKLITTATPTSAGTKILLEYDETAPSAALRMLDRRSNPLPLSLAGGLLGLAFFRTRKIKTLPLRSLNLLSAILLAVSMAVVLAGCATNTYTVSVTAAPVTSSAAAPPQSVIVYVSYKGS